MGVVGGGEEEKSEKTTRATWERFTASGQENGWGGKRAWDYATACRGWGDRWAVREGRKKACDRKFRLGVGELAVPITLETYKKPRGGGISTLEVVSSRKGKKGRDTFRPSKGDVQGDLSRGISAWPSGCRDKKWKISKDSGGGLGPSGETRPKRGLGDVASGEGGRKKKETSTRAL